MAEGNADIIETGEPDSFTPGVRFRVRPSIRNIGESDILWVTLTNIDTGAVFRPDPPEVYVSAEQGWVPSIYFTLNQITDFHGRLEAGHLLGVLHWLDDTEAFTIPSDFAQNPPTVFFSGNPLTIERGESSTLQWTVINATSVTLDGVSKGLTGTETRSPISTTTYTLIAGNDGGTTTKTVTITVTEPPPEIICTPGEKKCIGNDLYECNAAGDDWVLFEANAGICQTGGACPDFWVNPIGAVVCWILSAFEAAIGLVTGGFLTLQLNMKNFLDNYGTDLAAWLADPIGAIQSYLGGVIATINDVTNSVTTYVSDWWADTVDTLSTWMSDAWGTAAYFWLDITTHICDWWDDTKKSIWDGFISFKDDLSDALNTKFQEFIGFINTLPGDIVEYVTGFVAGAILGTLDTLFKGIQSGAEKEKEKRK